MSVALSKVGARDRAQVVVLAYESGLVAAGPDSPQRPSAHAGLTRCYGRRTVVDAVDLDLPRGVVAGLVGPNGAGKTTIMAMLLGLVRPSAGG